MEKHFIYLLRVGEPQERLFKIGTTNNIDRRIKEHKRYYKKDVHLLGYIPVKSEYTTLRVEKQTKELWKTLPDWTYMRNDRFIIPEGIEKVQIKVRKIYEFSLS